VASPDISTEKAAHFEAFGVKDHEKFYAGYPIATFHPLNPGSTFKVVTTAAVYNLKPSLANFVFPSAPCLSLEPFSNKSICNDGPTATTAHSCGGTIAEMLPPSCDPGYAKLGETLGATVLYKQAYLFGYDQVPPIDLPNVAASEFPPIATFSDAKLGPPGLAYSAFGQQDVLATTLQQAMVASAIADDGTLMTPHVMASIHAQDTTLVERYSPKVYKQSTTPAAAAQVNDLMQDVAKYGTAAGIFPATWQVAAKTGTAQTGTTDATTNTQDWMIAFAPASNPVVAVCVTVPYQPVSTSGALVAGPIMKAMLTAALHPPAGQ
jgi:peptidoglycan glycosyltransferase